MLIVAFNHADCSFNHADCSFNHADCSFIDSVALVYQGFQTPLKVFKSI